MNEQSPRRVGWLSKIGRLRAANRDADRLADVCTVGELGRRRLLFVGINYAPEQTGIAPYATQASSYFAMRGAQVLVLAGVPHYPQWTIPDEYRRRAKTNEQRGLVTVRRLWHTVPSRQSALTRSAYEATFGLHVAIQRLPWRPDVVVAVIPSLLAAVAAAVIARRTGAPLVLWVQDLMGAATVQSGIAGGGRISSITVALERWAIRQAQSVVVVSEAFRRYLRTIGVNEERIHLVPNWTHVIPPRTERAAVRKRLGWDENDIIALHSGNMGMKQRLENIVAAARMAPAQGIRFVLMGDGNQRRVLEQLSAGIPSLQMLPPANDDDFSDVLAAADVLLVNERTSALDMSLPSKLTSYFCAGIPIIAAVPAGGGTATEVERSGGGLVIPPENPETLLAEVQKLGADRLMRESLGRAGAEYARINLNRETSLQRLADVVAAAADCKGTASKGRRWPCRRPGPRLP